MKHSELASELDGIVAYEWVGSLGYNDVPYLLRGYKHLGRAPVAVETGFADGRPGYSTPAGDILKFLQSAQVGDCLVVPLYHGCHHDGNFIRRFTNNGWTTEAEYVEVEEF